MTEAPGSQPYRRVLDGVVVRSTRPRHARPLEHLQEICFPSLAPQQRFRAEHYRHHVDIFPEGQFCAVDTSIADQESVGAGTSPPAGRPPVVGMTSTLRMDFDADHPDHDFDAVIAGGWLAHDPEGPWLYGADMGVHPGWRRRGIGRALYRARQRTVRRLGLRGQVIVGMLSGYADHRDDMSIEEYYRRVVEGGLFDPTVSVQMRVGFAARALVRDYLDDPVCDDCGALLVLDADTEI